MLLYMGAIASGVSSVSTVQDLYNILANVFRATTTKPTRNGDADDLGDSHAILYGSVGIAATVHTSVWWPNIADAVNPFLIYLPGYSGNMVTQPLG